MSLWRLELLRAVRTGRWTILAAVYAFVGVLGAFGARYAGELLARFGGDIVVQLPDPRPVDAVEQYVSNASQLGLLAVLVVAAGALAIDARPEFGAFLRTRVSDVRRLVVPRAVVAAAGACGALVVGTGVLWALTVPLLGPLPAVPLLVGTAWGALYLCFAVAVVAVAASVARSTLTTVLVSVGALLALPVLGLLPPLAPWLPSRLVGAVMELVAGAPLTEHLRAVGVTVVVIPALLLLAIRRQARHET